MRRNISPAGGLRSLLQNPGFFANRHAGVSQSVAVPIRINFIMF